MTAQHPAAPETEALPCAACERDAVVEVGAYAQQKEATARAVNAAARMTQVAARRTRELAAMTARAESAEAAHEAARELCHEQTTRAESANLAREAEKAAHKRLRADGVRSAIYELGLWCGECDPADPDDDCCVVDRRVRALLAGGGTR